MLKYRDQIHRWMINHRNDGITLLQRMVREASTQGNESGVQKIVVDRLEQLGFVVDVWEPSGDDLLRHPYFSSPRNTFSGSPNVVGVLKGTGGGRSIILNGHVDVVPEGEQSQWEFTPL